MSVTKLVESERICHFLNGMNDRLTYHYFFWMYSIKNINCISQVAAKEMDYGQTDKVKKIFKDFSYRPCSVQYINNK